MLKTLLIVSDSKVQLVGDVLLQQLVSPVTPFHRRVQRNWQINNK